MQHISFFQSLSKKDVKIAGGKGASLGEIARLFSRRAYHSVQGARLGGQASAYVPIPLGFVITAAAFERFLHETDLKFEVDSVVHELNYKDIHQVESASEKIRDLIHDERMPKDLQVEVLGAFKKLKAPLVAVRSSATAEDSSQASWAGELESYLNTTEKNLLGNVKKCWSSLFTPRALVYRNEKGLHKAHVSVAVVVQKMVQSEVAGVCFTVHPVTKDKHQMIIEACWGLGEALVGGQVTPDAYVIDKRDWGLIDVSVSEQKKMIARKLHSLTRANGRVKNGGGTREVAVPSKMVGRQKLDGRQIVELAKLCAKIETHYKFPCDIEWALEKGKFYIVQSRPITTL